MSLYEYKHPIINKELVTGPDAASRKQFPTLEAWYDVVNDYEFQARCPVILKNSHRNKHFTFACHLKSCPFKVLLSYSGHNKDGPFESAKGEDDEDDEDEDEVDVGDDGEPRQRHQHHQHHQHLQHHQHDAGDDVSAAIAAAVAAVTDTKPSGHGSPSGDAGSRSGSTNGDDSDSLSAQLATVRGPFTVTKIDPYHNHPLESNLSLSKFVLTKVPRILQNDLKFDSILESLCNDDDNTVAKFRVSQYVEESGILDILKERYGLSDHDLDKKLLSHIARRITTYKARFVLKKKKNGTYGVSPNAMSMSAAAAAAAAISANGSGSGSATPQQHHHHHHPQQQQHHHHPQQHHLHHQQQQLGSPDLDKKRSYSTNEPVSDQDDDLDTRKRSRTNKISTAVKMGTRSSLVNDPGLAQLDDANDSEDNKLPQDVAEQLRLLSSHLKEVEQQQQQQEQEQEHHHHHNHEQEPHDHDHDHDHLTNHQHHLPHHQQEHHLNHNRSPRRQGHLREEDDENIQPELRGQ
ncbi:LANO_0D06766g1_1 [Lachancea nothofagi CBS 11611]|uniref:LANO_0D06766g1_1 n=1 Tax=Lachancea nothofagi CBS 11611 TaxID=1266666 RepID=A0A1G4JHJ9_9SACH|nr:LANO_0D06766g1_1 [Lachancea nothofagi CBS 11611]